MSEVEYVFVLGLILEIKFCLCKIKFFYLLYCCVVFFQNKIGVGYMVY